MRPSGTVAAQSVHFENLTANAHVYSGVSRCDRSWTRRVRKRAFYKIRNQIAWLLRHGQAGLAADELEGGKFVHPPVAKGEVEDTVAPTPTRRMSSGKGVQQAPSDPAPDMADNERSIDAPSTLADAASAASTSATADPSSVNSVPVLADVSARVSVKRRRHEDPDKNDADDSPVPRKRRLIRRAVAVRRQ
ncbi:hypothetical protein AMAG_03338 [Allomyces macrogynus ATCC 38327]|uniref:Uncharacterized protein n=1 Tax=Allomyces macrogynus (strain ATCC 38327) TaxID=578462 RepID=A0A0L0S8T6_ALLM3|nr:hypothetical protein AMAG_03338 [Allomyces macrogynus ATCC 38327]|eukprot:KNE58983.1 hypothetical protein AMAG_03338 [Allomyces macrogynus ATCC 38327]